MGLRRLFKCMYEASSAYTQRIWSNAPYEIEEVEQSCSVYFTEGLLIREHTLAHWVDVDGVTMGQNIGHEERLMGKVGVYVKHDLVESTARRAGELMYK